MSNDALQEKLLFLYNYIRNPKQMGSVTPSSKYLAAKMASYIPWSQVEAIAELGAGTGAVTKLIKQSVSKGTEVLLFEKEPYLLQQLTVQYPEFKCFSEALNIRLAMEQAGIAQLDGVISGLPVFNFHTRLREHLIEEIHSALKTGGLFVAFQYSLQMKKLLKEKFELEALRWVPWNIPSAFVYVCRKK